VFGDRELQLARTFWPGPLTIVLPARSGLAAAVLGGGTTVALRVPAHAVARALAAAFGFSITATSANRSGNPPAVTGADVADALDTVLDRLDVLLDCGAVTGGPPSTIVEMAESGPRLVRAGAVAWNRVLESIE
jgi:L-threonylcarbamoyladenylate synthase